MIVDSTVFIDCLRGVGIAISYLTNPPKTLETSRIVVMELMRGARSKKELSSINREFETLGVEVIDVDTAISQLASLLMERYVLRFGLGIADALIAATAIVLHKKLATQNIKHFRFIKDLELVKPY